METETKWSFESVFLLVMALVFIIGVLLINAGNRVSVSSDNPPNTDDVPDQYYPY